MDILLIIGLIVLNAAFAISEMALSTARKARLTAMMQQSEAGARHALELIAHPTRWLSAIQVGITSIGVLNGIVGEAAFSAPLTLWLSHLGIPAPYAAYVATGFVVAVITFLTIVFGELVPKRIGQTYPEVVSTWVARPMLGLAKLAAPFVWLLTHATGLALRLLRIRTDHAPEVTHAEIAANLEQGLQAGVIDAQEHTLVQNVFDLEERTLASLMRPRDKVQYLERDWPLDQVCHQATQGGHSWYPVLHEDWAHVQGMVCTSALMQRYWQNGAGAGAGAAWGDLVTPVRFVPETLSAMLLLSQFKRRTERMVLVVDEYGDVQGLITPQDLLEAITGELYTPTQSAAWGARLQEGVWLLDGQMPVQELKAQLKIEELPGEGLERYNTLGGLIMHALGRLPSAGDCAQVQGWTLQVREMQARRVASVIAQSRR